MRNVFDKVISEGERTLRPIRKQPMTPRKDRCQGIAPNGICSERMTCKLHLDQVAEPVPEAMRIGRVGSSRCSFRVEVAK